MEINLDGWTRQSVELFWRNGIYSFKAEPGFYPVEQYVRAMHPSDAAKYGFPHRHSSHDPVEEMHVIRVDGKPVVASGRLHDGYMSVPMFGRYAQEAARHA